MTFQESSGPYTNQFIELGDYVVISSETLFSVTEIVLVVKDFFLNLSK